MATAQEIVAFLMTPSWSVVILGLVVVLGAPIVLHLLLTRSASYMATPPVVLLMGPSDSGKTALLTLYERGNNENSSGDDNNNIPNYNNNNNNNSNNSNNSSKAGLAATRTSQSSQSVELLASTDSATRETFRNHAASDGTYTKFLLVDTPGHGKLRNLAMSRLSRATAAAAAAATTSSSSRSSSKLRAVVFVVDASALAPLDDQHSALAPTAQYLHDVLLLLQKRRRSMASSSFASSWPPMPVLVAANKMDLFTALPAAMVRANLEAEIGRIRASRSKDLLGSGVGVDEFAADDDGGGGGGGDDDAAGWLGEYGSDKFSFAQMREFGIEVDVLPGTVVADKPEADKWWWWIAQKI